MRPKVLFVVGTRPEVVKTATVIRELRKYRDVATLLAVTGQHRQLLDRALAHFGLKPDADLDLMRRGQSPQEVVAKVLAGLAPLLRQIRPSLLVVQGDTATAMAAALCAARLQVPIAHIEAGLRSHDLARPFPEELNRRVVSKLASLHFAPTAGNRDNLIREGIAPQSIRVTGNPGMDALQELLRGSLACPAPRPEGGRNILLTVHRNENLGARLNSIFDAVRRLLKLCKDAHVYYPVHLNPRIAPAARKNLKHERMHLLPPLDYPAFIAAASRMDLILSDSGGVQEEALSLGVPVLVLREVTDRPEALRGGASILVGTEREKIIKEAAKRLETPMLRRRPRCKNPFGDGRASPRIAREILDFLCPDDGRRLAPTSAGLKRVGA